MKIVSVIKFVFYFIRLRIIEIHQKNKKCFKALMKKQSNCLPNDTAYFGFPFIIE